MILDGKNAASPNPCNARKINSINQLWENPAMSEVMVNHTIPPKYSTNPPNMSAKRPKMSRVAVTTRDKAVAGQID